MKKKKAFTLIEVIAIIVILSIITNIVLPNVIKSDKKKKESQYEKLILTIENAAKIYLTESKDNKNAVLISTLMTEKYVDNVTNPVTGELLTGCVIKENNNGFNEYRYTDNCGSSLTLNPNSGVFSTTTGWTTNTNNTITKMYMIGTEVYGILPTATKTGYTFDGWYTSITGGTEITSETPVSIGNITLFARWVAEHYTVTLNAGEGAFGTNTGWTNGANNRTTYKEMTYASTYGTLPTPTRAGYTFDGWYKELACTNKVTNVTEILTSSNHMLYAKWNANTYTVTFDANGGNVGVISKTVVFDDLYGSLPTPTRSEYVFGGWYKELTYTNEAEATTMVSTPSNHTLYAYWIPDATYQFTYTGKVRVIDDGVSTIYEANPNGTLVSIKTNNFKIYFLSSGNLTFTKLDSDFDIFAVGSGVNGRSGGTGNDGNGCYGCGGAGGAGGKTIYYNGITMHTNETYAVNIGVGNTLTSNDTYIKSNTTTNYIIHTTNGAAAKAGGAAACNNERGGAGAEGVYAFDSSSFDGIVYGSGGGGGSGNCGAGEAPGGAGGTNAGGGGGASTASPSGAGAGGGLNATENTGSGGGGAGAQAYGGGLYAGGGGRGADGVIAMRKSTVPSDNRDIHYIVDSHDYNCVTSGTNHCKYSYNSNSDWTLELYSSGTLKVEKATTVDAFLVGGGGGGKSGSYSPGHQDYGSCNDWASNHWATYSGGAGGGGGEYANIYDQSLAVGSYNIIVGAGGVSNTNGGATTAFGTTVNGGATGAGGAQKTAGASGVCPFDASNCTTYYAAGGGGGGYAQYGCSSWTVNAGGAGGVNTGGAGGTYGGAAATAGTVHSGSGGGGAGTDTSGASGGSGIVLLWSFGHEEIEPAIFEYTGNVQTFEAPKTGAYRLEVWGGQGGGGVKDGSLKYDAAYGGYSTGIAYLTEGTTYYVVVGGEGEDAKDQKNGGVGGYNGGGTGGVDKNYTSGGGNEPGAGGGGATHIATVTGLLSDLSGDLSSILIAAGGAGGGAYYGNGGVGGGISGGTGSTSSTAVGTQTTGYAFGIGKDGSSYNGGSGGGGGGLYGGSSGGDGVSGAGGSGYIGNSLLSNKVMYCYNCTESTAAETKTISTTCTNAIATENCSKQGNGYAKITYIGT